MYFRISSWDRPGIKKYLSQAVKENIRQGFQVYLRPILYPKIFPTVYSRKSQTVCPRISMTVFVRISQTSRCLRNPLTVSPRISQTLYTITVSISQWGVFKRDLFLLWLIINQTSYNYIVCTCLQIFERLLQPEPYLGLSGSTLPWWVPVSIQLKDTLHLALPNNRNVSWLVKRDKLDKQFNLLSTPTTGRETSTIFYWNISCRYKMRITMLV